jgi:hypothetical protein
MDAQHTPGPWSVRPTTKPVLIDCDLGGTKFAVAGAYHFHVSESTAEANARLIAAAPDLLAALKRGETELDHQERKHRQQGWTISADCCREVANVIRAAIAKAEGK